MGTTKNEVFSQATTEMANLLKALGHPARFEIINLIKDSKDCTTNSILDLIPLSQSTISQHLAELRNAQIITAKNIGNAVSYQINDSILKKVENYFNPEKTKKEFSNGSSLESYNHKKSFKANPKLKKENYNFNHLDIKKSATSSD